MNADGTNQLRLTTNFVSDYDPTWSPDGTRIAFVSRPGTATGELMTMNPDGTDVVRLTNDGFDDLRPDWQPIPGPTRGDYKSAAQFCQADRDFLGDEAFGNKYGTNGNGANAYGKCVSQNQ
jgi:dipeptidyl aminopeptidase/acylaminoacyl peptidase